MDWQMLPGKLSPSFAVDKNLLLASNRRTEKKFVDFVFLSWRNRQPLNIVCPPIWGRKIMDWGGGGLVRLFKSCTLDTCSLRTKILHPPPPWINFYTTTWRYPSAINNIWQVAIPYSLPWWTLMSFEINATLLRAHWWSNNILFFKSLRYESLEVQLSYEVSYEVS